MLNFAKAFPSSTAVIRLLRRRGVFWTKESFFYNARWKILIDKATSKNELLIAMMTFISIFSCYTVACSGNHKLWVVTCKRGSFLPGDVKCKHRYFIILWFTSSGISAKPLMKNAFVYACIELKYGDISVQRLISNYLIISNRKGLIPFRSSWIVPFNFLCKYLATINTSWKGGTLLSSSPNMCRKVN